MPAQGLQLPWLQAQLLAVLGGLGWLQRPTWILLAFVRQLSHLVCQRLVQLDPLLQLKVCTQMHGSCQSDSTDKAMHLQQCL